MIDNVGFIVNSDFTPELENMDRNYSGDTFGNFKNFKIIHRPENIFCSGSLGKYLNGENVTNLSRKTLIKALKKLEDETGWNLRETEIKTLEIGATIPLKKPVSSYMQLWGRVTRNKKIDYWGSTLETVINKTGDRSFQGYDKVIESKKNIPEFFKGDNLLRLELKYKKGIKNYLGKLSLWDLTDKKIYSKLLENWKETYLSIPKKKCTVLDVSDNVNPKGLKDLLSSYGLNTYGFDNYISFINSLESSSLLGSTQARRARTEAKSLIENIKVSETNDLTYELDSKVLELSTKL
jgi:hypothetical protein